MTYGIWPDGTAKLGKSVNGVRPLVAKSIEAGANPALSTTFL